jgi:hypothetical protein
MPKSKEPCGDTANNQDGAYATCEKTRPHLVHKDGDLKFVALPGGVLTNGK